MSYAPKIWGVCAASRCLALAIVGLLLAAAGSLHAQEVIRGDRPQIYVPVRPPTQKELDRRESLNQYVLGLLCENEDRIFEALNAYQLAVKLDPEAPALYKAQVPILVALDRGQEALKATSKVVELDPSDYESWYMHARLLKALGKLLQARAALQSGLATDGAKEHPEIAHQMYFELGTVLELEGSLKPAAEAFAQSARILEHPDHALELGLPKETIVTRVAEVYERIGHLYRNVKQYDQAVEAFKKAQQSLPSVAGRINFNLAQIYVEQGNLAQALTAVEGYLRFQPQGMEAYELKLSLLDKLGRRQQIIPWLEEASKNDQFNVALKLFLANQYVDARLGDQAEKVFLDLGEKSPDVAVYRGLFRLYKQTPGGTNKILTLVDRVFDLASHAKGLGPNSAAPQAQAIVAALREDNELSKDLVLTGVKRLEDRNDKLKYETVHFLAVVADRLRQTDEAERFYRQCLASATVSNEAIIYGGLLRVLWKGRKYEDIVRLCRQSLARGEKGTNLILFRNDLAKALARLDRFDEALKEADNAVRLASDKEVLTVRFSRVRILAAAGKYDRAEAECMAMLKETISPGDAMEIRYLLSSIYSYAKQPLKSEEQLQWILNMDPNNPTANNDLGYLWADQGKNLEKAEEMIRKALDQDRRQRKNAVTPTPEDELDNAAYVDSLGWVLFRRGKIDEARKELERAGSLPDGDDPVISDHLGDVYTRLQMFEQARTSYQKAIQLYERERHHAQNERLLDAQRKLKMITNLR